MLSGYTPFWGEGNLILCAIKRTSFNFFFMRVDQASLFESIMSGEYEYDDEYWSDISNSGNIKHTNNYTALKTNFSFQPKI